MLCNMQLRHLPLLTGFLPIVAIHLSLVLAINAGVVPACFPYVEGCASISATGRHPPSTYLFKPAMTIEAVVMIIYWIANGAWIASLNHSKQKYTWHAEAFVYVGFGGAIALVIYVTFLGTQYPIYEFMRRVGIYFYFLLTVIAQLMLARKTIAFARSKSQPKLIAISRAQLLLALAPFALGALNFALKFVLSDSNQAENIIEWIVALIMHVFFILSFSAWSQTRFSLRLQTREI